MYLLDEIRHTAPWIQLQETLWGFDPLWVLTAAFILLVVLLAKFIEP